MTVRDRGDGGVTLVELLVVMVIIGVVGALLTQALILTSRNTRFNEDEARGLQDVRKVVERLGRDIRQARSIAAGADSSHLVLWIDENSDYKEQSSETITWEIQESLTEPGHYDVLRTASGEDTYRQATTLVEDIAFSYSTSATVYDQGEELEPTAGSGLSHGDAERVRLVTVGLTYNAFLAGGTGDRTVEFASRLRNVG